MEEATDNFKRRTCHNTDCGEYSRTEAKDGSNCTCLALPQLCANFQPSHPLSTIQEGVHNGQQEKPSLSVFNTIAAEIGELVTEKNRAYGNSFAKCGDFLRLLYPSGIAPEFYDDALAMVRIFDKQMRIATQKDALGESPYRDIAGYGILGAAKDQGKGE